MILTNEQCMEHLFAGRNMQHKLNFGSSGGALNTGWEILAEIFCSSYSVQVIMFKLFCSSYSVNIFPLQGSIVPKSANPIWI